MSLSGKTRAWLWVPTAYFAEGGPFMAVSTVSAILFKSLGMEDRYVALWTSLMMLPWSIKPLWAPFVDMFRTKRQWILATQLLMALLFTAMAGLIVSESLSLILIGVFFLLAFASATYDVAVDGFYLIALDKHEQAFFAGIRGSGREKASRAGAWQAGAKGRPAFRQTGCSRGRRRPLPGPAGSCGPPAR